TLPTPKPDAAAVSPARFVPVGTPAPVAPPSSAPAPFAPPTSAPAPFAPPASAVPTDTRREVPPPRRTPSALRRSQPPDEPAPPAPAYRARRSPPRSGSALFWLGWIALGFAAGLLLLLLQRR
ncbi:MAG TPA: hypothetical protein VKN99_04335, partial [Polyangia bacterium]|nr:hypothetical protein [Polyangia bacterium]